MSDLHLRVRTAIQMKVRRLVLDELEEWRWWFESDPPQVYADELSPHERVVAWVGAVSLELGATLGLVLVAGLLCVRLLWRAWLPLIVGSDSARRSRVPVPGGG